jgi:hypothetical protein
VIVVGASAGESKRHQQIPRHIPENFDAIVLAALHAPNRGRKPLPQVLQRSKVTNQCSLTGGERSGGTPVFVS